MTLYTIKNGEQRCDSTTVPFKYAVKPEVRVIAAMKGYVERWTSSIEACSQKGEYMHWKRQREEPFYVFISIAMVDDIIFAGPNQSVQDVRGVRNMLLSGATVCAFDPKIVA